MKSDHFDEVTDTIDCFVLRLKQCAQILGYNERKAVELFMNTLPTRHYYLLFGIQNLGETAESNKEL